MEKPPEKEKKKSALSRRASVRLHSTAMEVTELIELVHHLDLGLVR